MKNTVIERILARGLIAIIRGLSADDCLRMAEAIYEGGIDLIEVTFDKSGEARTCTEAVSAIDRRFGGSVLAGAGTVTTIDEVRAAHAAGARYIISPGLDAGLIRETNALGMVSIPGAMTPSEILAAHTAGADFVKLFPASVLGPDYVRAVRAPLSHIRLLAVGGIDASNIPAFRAAGCLGFGVGGRLVSKAWLASGETQKITAAARELVRAAAEA